MTPSPAPRSAPIRPFVDLDALRGRPLIPVEECGAMLGRGRSASYEDARRGNIPIVTLGRRSWVPVPELLRMLGFGEGTISDLFMPSRGGDIEAVQHEAAVVGAI